jgi:hypothetical protein
MGSSPIRPTNPLRSALQDILRDGISRYTSGTLNATDRSSSSADDRQVLLPAGTDLGMADSQHVTSVTATAPRIVPRQV